MDNIGMGGKVGNISEEVKVRYCDVTENLHYNRFKVCPYGCAGRGGGVGGDRTQYLMIAYTEQT